MKKEGKKNFVTSMNTISVGDMTHLFE